jgi:hypothetical protein
MIYVLKSHQEYTAERTNQVHWCGTEKVDTVKVHIGQPQNQRANSSLELNEAAGDYKTLQQIQKYPLELRLSCDKFGNVSAHV